MSDTDFFLRRKKDGFFVMTDCGVSGAGGGGGLAIAGPGPAALRTALALPAVVVVLAGGGEGAELELEPPPNTRLKNPGRALGLLGGVGMVVAGGRGVVAKAERGGRTGSGGGGGGGGGGGWRWWRWSWWRWWWWRWWWWWLNCGSLLLKLLTLLLDGRRTSLGDRGGEGVRFLVLMLGAGAG